VTPVDALRGARALVVASWGQGHGALPPTGDCDCIVTAIAKVCGINTTAGKLSKSFLAQAINDPKISEHSLFVWNDDEKRTKPQVIAMFDRAIELAEAA
jgi:hypothetical protein